MAPMFKVRRTTLVLGGALAATAFVPAALHARGPAHSQAQSAQSSAKDRSMERPMDEKHMDPAELEARKERLSGEQYRVTQESATEPPFRNAYWNNHAPGIYVDVVSGEPLFSSREKFDSGTGWPSFWAPLEKANVVEENDHSMFMQRTEVHSRGAHSHLGHLFDDGPAPTGMRYCINSAALRFVPAERLAAEGYAQYAKLFPDVKQVDE